MKKKYISFEQSKLLKEKGFDIECSKGFLEDGIISISHYSSTCTNDNNDYPTKYSAPEQHQVVDWLLEKHGIWVEVLLFNIGWLEENKMCFQYRVYNKSEDWITGLEFKTPQEAYSAAFNYVLKELI